MEKQKRKIKPAERNHQNKYSEKSIPFGETPTRERKIKPAECNHQNKYSEKSIPVGGTPTRERNSFLKNVFHIPKTGVLYPKTRFHILKTTVGVTIFGGSAPEYKFASSKK